MNLANASSILASLHLYAASGAAALFLAESVLLGLALAGGRKRPHASA